MSASGTTPSQHEGRFGGPIPGRLAARSAAVRTCLTALLACLLACAALGAPGASARAGAASTAKAYVEQFYPLWFTSQQLGLAPHNQLVGPDRISPLYQTVVAINDDTLYCSTPVDLSVEPVILTVPPTSAGYSVLTLDPYGNVFTSGVPSKPSGTITAPKQYALVPPGYTGPLPFGAERIEMPYPLTFLIFRIDKFSPSNEDQTQEASLFRKELRLQPKSAYELAPLGGTANVVPELFFGIPFKTIADTLLRFDPIRFLARLQEAVHSSTTPPLTAQQQALSDAFDASFGSGGAGISRATRLALAAGARKAHSAIVDSYLEHRDRNQWIHFTNIGDWGNNALDRASITEYIQYGNGISTSAYYHTFRDRRGVALRGSARRGYVMTFRRGKQPPAGRFWSLTAYTPESVELIPNAVKKYLVARYTPGLRTKRDGSVSIYISRHKPRGVPSANWLPVSSRPFNLMLRVYGVEQGSSVAENTYVPPAIVKR